MIKYEKIFFLFIFKIVVTVILVKEICLIRFSQHFRDDLWYIPLGKANFYLRQFEKATPLGKKIGSYSSLVVSFSKGLESHRCKNSCLDFFYLLYLSWE